MHCIPDNYCVIMGLRKKRKQNLSLISALAAESHKHRKINQENEHKKEVFEKTERKSGLLG